jgi:hypothetical protein
MQSNFTGFAHKLQLIPTRADNRKKSKPTLREYENTHPERHEHRIKWGKACSLIAQLKNSTLHLARELTVVRQIHPSQPWSIKTNNEIESSP